MSNRVLSGSIWVVSTGRNALVVLVSSVLAYSQCTTSEGCPFILTGKVKSGLPRLAVPKFETTILGPNGTMETQDFSQMVRIALNTIGVQLCHHLCHFIAL